MKNENAKNVLVLGGTKFFGRNLVDTLLKMGHTVTIGTRGKTPDYFGDRIFRVAVNRESKESMAQAFADTVYDIVYDNICYSSNSAKTACEVFAGKIQKYIFTSTLSVYDCAENLKESDFDPYEYPIKYGDIKDFDYQEGKRQAEAVFFQEALFPVAAMRIPIVIGEDDYTRRFSSYVTNIHGCIPFYVDNPDVQMSFITDEQAGEFLYWLGTTDCIGPFNAGCNGTITIHEIIRSCEKIIGKNWIAADKTCSVTGAFNQFGSHTLNNEKAASSGFIFHPIDADVCDIIQRIAEKL